MTRTTIYKQHMTLTNTFWLYGTQSSRIFLHPQSRFLDNSEFRRFALLCISPKTFFNAFLTATLLASSTDPNVQSMIFHVDPTDVLFSKQKVASFQSHFSASGILQSFEKVHTMTMYLQNLSFITWKVGAISRQDPFIPWIPLASIYSLQLYS